LHFKIFINKRIFNLILNNNIFNISPERALWLLQEERAAAALGGAPEPRGALRPEVTGPGGPHPVGRTEGQRLGTAAGLCFFVLLFF
jgi:hypothetical protein